MPIDPNVFNNIKTFADYNRADQDFQLKKALTQQAIQTGGIDAASKANVYATQLLSGAAAGGQPAYDQARQTLAAQGIDTSNYAPDVQTAAQQLQAARLAQSPIGSLLNTGLKMDSNDLAKAALTGVLPSGSNISSIVGGIIPNQGSVPNQNPMLPALIKQESGGNPNAVSPAGAQGIAQIMPATAKDPGYGVQPLQGWDGVNPASAPVPEQMRFANDYLNAMQQHNGGNPQLAAAAYNAGPGRVDAALAQLPAETQNYVAKVAPFNPPPQASNETLPAYKDRVQLAFEQYKLNNGPAIEEANATAKKTGEAAGDVHKSLDIMLSNLPTVMNRFQTMRDNSLKANYGTGTNEDNTGIVQNYYNNFDGSSGIPGVTGETARANALLKQASSQAVLPELGPMLSQAGVKGNKFLESLANDAVGLNLSAPPSAKLAVVNGLDKAYVSNLKSTAAQARAQGLQAPTDAQIDALVAKAKSGGALNTPNATQTPQGNVVPYTDYFK